MDLNKWFRESCAAGLIKLDNEFNISIDPAYKGYSDPPAINCSDIKRKSTPQLREFEKDKETSIDEFDVFQQQGEQILQKIIADICEESGRTQEWVETSYEYKSKHYKCEYCGEASNIECHDVLPYHRLNEGQRHDRDFLKQNLISLCHEHHHNVAHLSDPYWIKFDPRIREICELHLRSQRLKDE